MLYWPSQLIQFWRGMAGHVESNDKAWHVVC